MSHGFAIATTGGFADVGSIRSARLVASHSRSGTSGSITVSAFNAPGGFIWIRPDNGPAILGVTHTFNNSTKVFEWETVSGSSVSFTAFFFESAQSFSGSGYGVMVRNAAGETIIDNSLPVMSVKRTVSRSASVDLGGTFVGTYGGTMALTGTEVLMFTPAIGQWISAVGIGGDTGVAGWSSNQSTVTGVVLDRRDALAAPTGFGAAVLNGSGAIMWAHDIAAGWVRDGFSVSAATQGPSVRTWDMDMTGNAFMANGGSLYLDLDAYRYRGIAGRRTTSNNIRFEWRTVGWFENGNPPGPPITGGAVFNCRLSGILGNVT